MRRDLSPPLLIRDLARNIAELARDLAHRDARLLLDDGVLFFLCVPGFVVLKCSCCA